MDEQDIPYLLKALQQKSTELFQVTITYEAKFQRQNDIIDVQNTSIRELNEQLQNLSKPTRRKKTEDSGDF
tara:strand:+ start:1626 stop:1838 length:213 start_codon:yes stop_codon:yes gene_type:complete